MPQGLDRIVIPAAAASSASRLAMSASTAARTASNNAVLSANWCNSAPLVTPAAAAIASVDTSANPARRTVGAPPPPVRHESRLSGRPACAVSARRRKPGMTFSDSPHLRKLSHAASGIHTYCLYVSLQGRTTHPSEQRRNTMVQITAAGDGIAGLTAAPRKGIAFRSGADDCAAWHYRGSNGACVVMAGGAGVTKEPATDRFAARFHAAGYSVLAFDHRHIGESGGTPRQVMRVREQVADWEAALDCAAALPGVGGLGDRRAGLLARRGALAAPRLPGPRASIVLPQ